jgi:hypothetical protein
MNWARAFLTWVSRCPNDQIYFDDMFTSATVRIGLVACAVFSLVYFLVPDFVRSAAVSLGCSAIFMGMWELFGERRSPLPSQRKFPNIIQYLSAFVFLALSGISLGTTYASGDPKFLLFSLVPVTVLHLFVVRLVRDTNAGGSKK